MKYRNEHQDGSSGSPFESSGGLRVLDIPQVRVSSASFVRIFDDLGRYALLVNKNRARKGQLVYTPIGGAIEATSRGLRELEGLLGVTSSAFEKGNDLRFVMPGAVSNSYREWFLSGSGRERDPSREIIEELVEEAELLERRDLSGLRCSLAGYDTELAETSRSGQEGQMTLRLLEIHDATIPDRAMGRLLEASQLSGSLLRFVSSAEIASGSTSDGAEIGTVAVSLLRPQYTIPEFS